MQRRINFIDIARSFAIFFIVLGHTLVHSANCGIIFKLLYSFHVVLFFILSGYTFKIKGNESFKEFLKNKFFRIMIPYFVWSILFLIPYMLFGKNVGADLSTNSSFDLKTQLLNVLYGNGNSSALKQNSSLWFLPAIFSMELVYYFIIKFINKFNIKKIFILIPMVSISYITNSLLNVYLPWGINTVLVVGVFFYIGYLFKEYNLLTKEKLFNPIYIIICLIIGLCSFYFNTTVSCIDYYYGSLTLTLLSGLCLSIVTIYISYLINKNQILEYIGRNSMGILIFHKLIVLVFQTKLGTISLLLKDSNIFLEVLLSVIIVVISIICSLISTMIIKGTIPIVIGEKTKLNKKINNTFY